MPTHSPSMLMQPPRPILASALSVFAAAACAGMSAHAADRRVPVDYPTIQAAVDAAADGDTIRIAAGVYVEQTSIIRKNVTLIGEPGTILRAFPDMAADDLANGIHWRSVLYVHQSPNVAIRDLCFEGDQLGDQQHRGMIGAYFLDSGGTVENCRFTGFRERVPNTVEWDCWALRFLSDLNSSPVVTARVIGNTIVDCYGGIQVTGAPDVLTLDFIIRDNVIRGVGPTTKNGTLRGISLGYRTVGAVENNTISGYSYIGSGAELPFGYGILAFHGSPGSLRPLDGIRFEGNLLKDNNLHLTVMLGNDKCPILNNRFQGSAPTNRPVGLWLTGEKVPARGNTFRDLDEGIRLGGEDPFFGTDLGIAVDAQLTDNRFSNVDTPIDHQPQSSATEEGTLLPPWPAPMLDVDKAVLLSWPDFHEGWSLEASPDMAGPWAPVDLPLRRRDGRNEVFVPVDGAGGFFRLVQDNGP